MRFEELLRFLEHDMRMSHVYQPVMIRVLLDRSGHATIADIASALLHQDRSQLDYYAEITRNMVGRVLTNRGVVRRDGARFELLGFDALTPEQVEHLKTVCDVKLGEYVTKRGIAIWEHRRRSAYLGSGIVTPY